MAKNVQIIPDASNVGYLNFTDTGSTYGWRLLYNGTNLYFEDDRNLSKVLTFEFIGGINYVTHGNQAKAPS